MNEQPLALCEEGFCRLWTVAALTTEAVRPPPALYLRSQDGQRLLRDLHSCSSVGPNTRLIPQLEYCCHTDGPISTPRLLVKLRPFELKRLQSQMDGVEGG